jgi:hypothetical protein
VTSSVPDLRSAFAGARRRCPYTLDTLPLDATGKASITVSGLGAGNHFVTASFGNSSSTMVQAIHAQATTIRLASSMSPSRTGREITITATIVPSTSGFGVPTGMVTFTDGGKVIGQFPLRAGTASLTAPELKAGVHLLGAVYSSVGTFAASSATLTHRAAGTNPLPVARNLQ